VIPGTTPVPGTTSGGVVGQPGGVGGVYGTSCELDTRQIVEKQGRYFEILTSRGRLFEFENGVPVQAAGLLPNVIAGPGGYDLLQVPLYAQGPCAGMPALACVFDSQAFVLLPEGRFLEYVTVGSRQWVFENGAMTGAGLDLATIPRYANMCSLGAQMGSPCIIDTRTFLKQGPVLVESVTAFGRLWEWDIDANIITNGVDLMSIPRFANGPCAGQMPGSCTFNTRTYEPAAGGLLEVVTVDQMAFRMPVGAVAAQATPISATPHWLNGPCR